MLIHFSLSAAGGEIPPKNNIPIGHEASKITLLFRYLVLHEGFGYTLFGTKPLSCVSFIKDTSFLIDSVFEPNSYAISRVYWSTWKKFFPNLYFNNFIFVENFSSRVFQVYLVNKKLCLKIIKEHVSDFQNILKINKSPKEILNHIIQSKNIFNNGLCRSHYLMGLLFGYGKKNAMAFEKTYVKKQYFYKALQPFTHEENSDPIIMPLPQFVVTMYSEEDMAEAKRLRRAYNRQRNYILKNYEEGNFLEITLEKLQE